MKHTMKRTKNKELNMVDLKKLTAIEQMKLHIHIKNTSIIICRISYMRVQKSI